MLMIFQGVSAAHTTYTTAARGRQVSAENSSSQCDIYSSLSRDAQRYTDSVASMGFDLSEVARTVSKLGVDDKLVCSLSSFTYFVICGLVYLLRWHFINWSD